MARTVVLVKSFVDEEASSRGWTPKCTMTNNGKTVIGAFDGRRVGHNRGRRVMDEQNKGPSQTHPGFYMYGSMDNAA